MAEDSYSTVDASRPFHSVKEAVAIFGERVLRREIQSPLHPPTNSIINNVTITPPSPQFTSEKQSRLTAENATSVSPDASLYEPPTPSPEIITNENNFCPSSFSTASSSLNESTPSSMNLKQENNSSGKVMHGNDLVMMLMILKRLESELHETKMEVKLLKERELENEVALASLNAELHKNLSNIAKAEANEAAKAVTKSSIDEERRRCEVMVKNVDSPTLAQILKITDYDSYFGDSKRVKKSMKKKPIIPLVTDLFLWKKRETFIP